VVPPDEVDPIVPREEPQEEPREEPQQEPGEEPITCGERTPANIEGPFFMADSPERADLRGDRAGTPVDLMGRVLTPACEPRAGALMEFWQADHEGAYDHVGYTYRGHQYTDAEGRYALRTVVPGRYPNGGTMRPSHIHVKVAGSGTDVFTTQLYFAGDPFNAGDPWFNEALLLRPVDGIATFDFVL
jgi:protocatechuate 3,4-dioxygenase beta subunit